MSVRKGSKIIAGSYKVVKTDVYTQKETDELLDLKQDKLTAGENIIIDENNVISTSGGAITNIVQETGDSSDSVMSQYAVTSELNKKVNSADLPVVATTGNYNDLDNKPDLSTYPEVKDLSDIAFTGDYNDLSNAPTLGVVATTNNYNDLDNKPIIPTKTSQLDNDRDFITHHALLPYETIGSNDYKLSLKQNKLIAGNGIAIEDDTISSTVDTAEWGKIIGDISAQEDLQGEFTAIRNAIEDNSLNKNQVTNCILEVPQRVKLELNNGVLTLKAGSQVIVPNGFEDDGTTPKFDYTDITTDLVLTRTWGTAEPVCIFFNLDDMGIAMGGVARFTSGTTAPTATNAQWWYDTTTNLIKRYSSASDSGSRISFPIAICNKTESVENSVIASIKQVFNGIGYIGSTVWVDKGVKGLIPNGRNEDGTLRNVEFVTRSLLVTTNPANQRINLSIVISSDTITRVSLDTYKYDEANNLNFDGELDKGYFYGCICATYNRDASGNVTSFNPKQPINLLHSGALREALKGSLTECIAVVETYQNGTSWYRVYSDGWCEQGGYISANGTVSFLKPFIDTNYTLVFGSTGDTNGIPRAARSNRTTSSFAYGSANQADAPADWQASGYIA